MHGRCKAISWRLKRIQIEDSWDGTRSLQMLKLIAHWDTSTSLNARQPRISSRCKHKLSLGLDARCLHLLLGCNNSTNKVCGLTSQCFVEPSFLSMFLNRLALFADSFEIVWFGFWFLVALLRRNLTLTSTQLH